MDKDKNFEGEGDPDVSGVMNPKEPSQAELDADRAANPDTSDEKSKDGSA